MIAAHWEHFIVDAERLRPGMGMPGRVWAPDSDAGRHVLEQWDGEPGYPLVHALDRPTIRPSTVRDVAISIYGAPAELDLDPVVDIAVVGSGPAPVR